VLRVGHNACEHSEESEKSVTAAWIGGALLLGLLAKQIGLPPLVGFLAAGFGLRALGMETTPLLGELSDAGVLLLLFAVGLKLRVKTLFSYEVWGTALAHLAIIAAGVFIVIAGGGMPWPVTIALATAMGFSSTVFAAKVLEENRELRAVHGRIAVGILIVQDIVAVGMLALLAVNRPSPFAFVLVLLPALRWLLGRLLDLVGHGELLVLFGVVLAVAVGGVGFESLGLSSELGALILGMLLSEHRRAQELSTAVWGLKEFFLVGFFLSIGLAGTPEWQHVADAALLVALLPVKAAVFFLLLLVLGLRARTSFLTALCLATYSEFGLIVVQLAADNGFIAQDWLTTAGLAVALSFALAAPLNRHAHALFGRAGGWLERLERNRRHPDDEPVSLGSAEVLIIGMGRVGTGAYDYLHQHGEHVVGADSDPGKLEASRAAGRRVVYADAEDASFWHLLNVDRLKAILLAIPDVEAKKLASVELRRRGYAGFLSATHVFEEEREPILAAGCDATYNYFTEAGVGFARDSWEALDTATDSAAIILALEESEGG
jgi:predicted Kef-type K+ transport protein